MKYICIICLVFLTTNLGFAGWDDPFYDFRGFNPTRESNPYEPEEYFDPFTGNFTLIYTDIYLPGNGGLDLKIMRVYNSNIYRDWLNEQTVEPVPDSWVGLGWSLHMGRLVVPDNEPFYLEMPDASKHYFYLESMGFNKISKDYWILKQIGNTYEVLFTDGIKWVFDMNIIGTIFYPGGVSVNYYPTKEIHDPSGQNKITMNYFTMGNAETAITDITDACNREITFNYDTGAPNNLNSILVNGKLYEYKYDGNAHWGGYDRLTAVKFPGDPAGYNTYEYTYSDDWNGYVWDEMTNRKNPWGGIVEYFYDFHTFNIGGQDYKFRVLKERKIDADNKWLISYVTAANLDDSTLIERIVPNVGAFISYKMYGYNHLPPEGENWRIGLILNKTIYLQPPCDLYVKYNYTYVRPDAPISFEEYEGPTTVDYGVYVPQLDHKEIITKTRDNGFGYTTAYNTSYADYEYGHPKEIVECGGVRGDGEDSRLVATKTTTRSYWYNIPKNIIDKIATETVTYDDATGPAHTESYTYYTESGKIQSKNIDGISTDYSYHSNNWNLNKVTDAENRYIEYRSYKYGIPYSIYDSRPFSPPIERDINWEGTIKWEEDRRDHKTQYEYDGRNRLTKIIPPLGNNPTIIEYATNNTWKKTTLDNGHMIEHYDNFGRLDLRENSLGIKVDYDYNVLGWLTYKSFPYDNTRLGILYTYDYLGRIKEKQYPDGRETFLYYDYCGGMYSYGRSVVAYLDQTAYQGHTIKYAYRVFGNPFQDRTLAKVRMSYNNNLNAETIEYSYNNAGKLTELKHHPYTRSFTYQSDKIGLLQSESSLERGEISYLYEENGNLKRRTDANGNITTYSYDNANRLIAIDYPGTLYDVIYGYDQTDNLNYISTPSCVRDYMFDEMNRVEEDKLQIDLRTFIIGYDYDPNGNLQQITYPDMTMVTYTSDNENRVQTVPGFISGNITYHPSGRASQFTTVNNRRTDVSFGNHYRVSRIQVDGAIMDEAYTYDEAGNLLTLIDPSGTRNFEYDDFHRLITFNAPSLWGTGSYSYQNVCLGRRQTENINGQPTTYVYDANNRLDYTSDTKNYNFTYDSNGNVTAIENNKTITYDYENRPVSIVDFVSFPPKTTALSYDGAGKRVKKLWGSPFDPFAITYYYMISPGGVVLYEERANGSVKNKYIPLNGELLAKVDINGSKYFYHNDYLGNARVITDINGSNVYSWLGLPFGEQHSVSNPELNYFRFTGKELDASTNFYYYGARYYFAEVGIFITPEPLLGADNLNISDPLSLKFYDYCRNNPLQFVDPDGEWYVKVEDNVWYIYRLSPNEATIREIECFALPFMNLAHCISRKITGDVTLEDKDWAHAVANLATLGIDNVVTSIALNVLNQIDYKLSQKTVYKSFSETDQAMILDPVIFRRLMIEFGLKETALYSQLEINLGRDNEKIRKVMKRLYMISNDVARRERNQPPLYLR